MFIKAFISGVILSFFIPAIGFTQQQNPDTAKVRQKDLLGLISKYIKFKKRKIPKDRKVFFSFLPISGASTNGNSFVVSSVNATFRLGDLNTNLSSIYFIPYTNLSTRFGFIIKPNVWLKDNKWNLNGDQRIIHNDVETYGLGSDTYASNGDLISNDQVRIYVNANRQVIGNFYLGFGYNLDYFYHIRENWTQSDESDFKKYAIGTGSTSVTSGVGPNIVFDSRGNVNNPISGIYSSLSFRLNPKLMGSTYNWYSLYFDNRKYIPLSDHWHSVLAFWAVYWGTFGDVPYLDLPTTAGDISEKIGRGYIRWRYRGKQMLYGESEYRFDITANGLWGGVVFANVESFTEPATNRFAYLLPAVGTGLRVKFNKKSNVNMTLDFAVGKNSFDWHLSLGEFF
jgi:outer membrane protein assembly factor BamA